jgi:ubiquinone/menaquinone biosynthesis C-methylase UbiE
MTDPGATTPDPLRAQVHSMWAGVAAQWADHADTIDDRSRELTATMLARVGLTPGARVLELACGPGGTGIDAAEAVGPAGEVVLSDVVPAMTEIAAARAAARGVTNVVTRVLDLEAIDEPDGSYDAVLCREGLMFAVDPAVAVAEIARVLRPGGRVAAAVWGPRVDNPWLGLVLDAVSEQLGMPIPPPGVPGPFSLGDAGELVDLFTNAGLGDAVVEPVPTPLHAASFEQWWERTTAVAGPIGALLQGLPAEMTDAITERLRHQTGRYTSPEGIDLPGVSLLASATRR